MGGLEKEGESKQSGRWGRNVESEVRKEEERNAGREVDLVRQGRRIRKEAGDDVTMQLTPPAPALHWGWICV